MRSRRISLMCAAGLLLIAIVLAIVRIDPAPITATATMTSTLAASSDIADPLRQDHVTLCRMLEMPDEELERVDPVIMNLIVLRGIPDYADTDISRYVRQVNEWADRIRRGLDHALGNGGTSEPAYLHDPDLWRAGGMAVAVAGPSIGITYTAQRLNESDASQLFLPGLIDDRRGTCSNMPVLYLAIAHRMGWPLKAVVSRDHMWTRWDDGANRFNLEATTATSDGQSGSFLSTPDEEYVRQLGTPRIAIECGSDFSSLTARQTLGVYLQTRAGYWAARGAWDRAEQDLLLARTCFPENRDILAFLAEAMAHRAKTMFTIKERREIGSLLASRTAFFKHDTTTAWSKVKRP